MSSQPIFDKSLELKASGTITATETGTALAMPIGKVWSARAMFEVTALDRTSADETYVISLEVSSDNFSTVTKQIAALVSLTATGRYEIGFTGAQIEAVCPGATHIRHKVTVGGTTPSMTFSAFLTKI